MLIYYILRQFLTPILKKIVRGTLVRGGGCACKTWSFSSACKNLGVQHPYGLKYGLPKKSIWVVMISPLNSVISGPKFTEIFFAEHGRNCSRKCSCLMSNIFICSGYICCKILKSFEIGPNFACFWSLKFLLGGLPKILDWDCIIKYTSDHGAKYCGDRPTELRDLKGKAKPCPSWGIGGVLISHSRLLSP